ncbi:hypothetical protein TTHT_0159 [Thermotomaculum hydrothermale]|uniref:Uncharacterized protein n=1 Tax=Thermotomaculum hydrothermale TaxID=981385 RepID=A0A7R6SYE9_9BACT|nr:hypothetical protein [Thermotomaculum hydrothermale]BBB31800.1 hypothetical protein TTHT_0159 [Thermotomaculum hydrothermale]
MRKLFILLAAMILSVGLASAHNDMDGNTGTHQNHEGMEMENNLVIPHIHIGGRYQTVITVFNPGISEDATGTLYFYNQDGSRLALDVNGQFGDNFEITVPAGGMVEVTLGNPENEKVIGWATYIVDENDQTTDMGDGMGDNSGNHGMMSDHVFLGVKYKRFDSNGVLATQVGTNGMRFMAGMMRGFAAPIVNDENNITGLAMVNTSDTDMNATLILKDVNGVEVFRKDITLLAGQQTVDILANFLSEYQGINNFKGVIEIRAEDDGIVPLVLINSNGIQTAIPLVPIPDAMGNMDGSGMGGGMGGMN